MMKIYLNNKKRPEKFILIDASDFDSVSRSKWYLLDSNKKGNLFYAIRKDSLGKTELLHRFLMGPIQLDHINGNGLDCRRKNLRECSREENARNRIFTKNKTGYVGVYKVKNKFQASIRINGKNKSLGYYASPELASFAREAAAKEIFGKYHPSLRGE